MPPRCACATRNADAAAAARPGAGPRAVVVAVRHPALVVRRVVAALQEHRPCAGAAGQVTAARPGTAGCASPAARHCARSCGSGSIRASSSRPDARHRRGRRVPAGARRGVVPPRHAVGRGVRHREAGRPSGRVEKPLVVRLAVGRGEAVHRPGCPRPRSTSSEAPCRVPAPGRQAGLLVEPQHVERAAVGADVPPRRWSARAAPRGRADRSVPRGRPPGTAARGSSGCRCSR